MRCGLILVRCVGEGLNARVDCASKRTAVRNRMHADKLVALFMLALISVGLAEFGAHFV
jgi:hypothetical protein